MKFSSEVIYFFFSLLHSVNYALNLWSSGEAESGHGRLEGGLKESEQDNRMEEKCVEHMCYFTIILTVVACEITQSIFRVCVCVCVFCTCHTLSTKISIILGNSHKSRRRLG